MGKTAFKYEVNEVPYDVEAEMLPSGSAAFTFTPPLPGRAPVIHVHEDVVADIVRMVFTEVEYDHDLDGVFLTLSYVGGEGVQAMKDEETGKDDPNYRTATQYVPNDLVLDMVLDWVTDPCPDCERLHFGEDIWPSLPDAPASECKTTGTPAKKTEYKN